MVDYRAIYHSKELLNGRELDIICQNMFLFVKVITY